MGGVIPFPEGGRGGYGKRETAERDLSAEEIAKELEKIRPFLKEISGAEKPNLMAAHVLVTHIPKERLRLLHRSFDNLPSKAKGRKGNIPRIAGVDWSKAFGQIEGVAYLRQKAT